MLTRIVINLRGLRLGNLISKDTTDAFTAGVHMQHDLSSLGSIHIKKGLQDFHHEVHWGVVVVQQYHLVQRWGFQPRLGLFDYQAALARDPTFSVEPRS